MDELIRRIHDETGLSLETSESVLGIILNFLRREGPEEPTARLMDKLPGAEHLVREEAAGETGQPGLLGGFAEMLAGGGGVMTAFNDLTAAGLDMEQIQTAIRAFDRFAREHAGEETVDEVIRGIPALARMV